jgi:hypothetical protein
MAQTTKATIDHDSIRKWAEKHGGHPAKVKGTGGRNQPPILRIDFPGFAGEGKLEPIRWDDFCRWFDASGLALLYREQDRFNKLVSRETVADQLEGEPRRRRTTQTRARARASGRATTARAETPRKRATTTGHPKRAAGTKKAKPATARTRTTTRATPEKRPRAR